MVNSKAKMKLLEYNLNWSNYCREYIRNSQIYEMQNREKYVSKKTITKDNIYVVRQFVYVHKIAVISLFTGKITRCGSTIFTLKRTHKP